MLTTPNSSINQLFRRKGRVSASIGLHLVAHAIGASRTAIFVTKLETMRQFMRQYALHTCASANYIVRAHINVTGSPPKDTTIPPPGLTIKKEVSDLRRVVYTPPFFVGCGSVGRIDIFAIEF
ncbi:MAG: hypothetical protein WCI20_04345 [bacterium]